MIFSKIPKIILASGSPQRKKLMHMIGLPFTVRISQVQEITKIKTTCAALVKANALLKAKDVAADCQDGEIVIGADTVIYIGDKKVIGKPKDLKEAKKNLKILMSRPQWVYTGVAVINKKNNRVETDYEKTRVHMDQLSDEEIDRYYQDMSPLDKAGGFDIEGKGGLFIKKIQGCYYNVIGLPVAKLTKILKKVGVNILGLVLCLSTWGCATEYNLATQSQESLIFGTEKEIKLGESLARQIEEHYKVIDDMDVNERINRIGQRIAEICDRKELVYTFKVIAEDGINAVSLPGGFVYVFKGLMDKIENDDQLAGVLAHEVGHIAARHSIKKLQTVYGYSIFQLAAVQVGGGKLARGLDTAFLSVFLEYSRQDEFEADRLGVKYTRKAGFNPQGVVDCLKKLNEVEQKEVPKEFSYWRTHPFLSQRIAAANQEVAGQIEFKDYLNLTGEDK